jgi:ribonuclease R
MEDKIGQEFTGVISGVTSFGMFVEIQEYYVEGLIHMSALHNDYYQFMEDKLCLVGEHTGQMYRIGDELKVRLYRVDLPRRYIDFELADSVNG